MKINALRDSGTLTFSEIEYLDTSYKSWASQGFPYNSEMLKVGVPRLLKTVKTLKGALTLDQQVQDLQAKVSLLQGELERVRGEAQVVTPTSSKFTWQASHELATVMGVTTVYIQNMGSGNAPNRLNVERRKSSSRGRRYDYRLNPRK